MMWTIGPGTVVMVTGIASAGNTLIRTVAVKTVARRTAAARMVPGTAATGPGLGTVATGVEAAIIGVGMRMALVGRQQGNGTNSQGSRCSGPGCCGGRQ